MEYRSASITGRVGFLIGLVIIAVSFPGAVRAQSQADEQTKVTAPVVPSTLPVVFTTEEDHRQMLEQLGITKLRPGRSSHADSPSAANYDEAKANPYPDLPSILESKDLGNVVSAQQWWASRRPQIVALLESGSGFTANLRGTPRPVC